MSETGFVYTLSDPRTGNVRYVGATINPGERLKQHTIAPHSDRLSDWVDDLEDDGFTPDMSVINVANVDKLSEKEKDAVQRLSDRFELLNAENTPGYSDGHRHQRELNAADRQILDVMVADGGRLRPTHIAEDADLGRSYVSQRLKRLVEHGHVAQPRSGLYEYVDDPREEADGNA